MKEPVDHILRPRLPWRPPTDPAVTECGYNAAKVSTLTREQFTARLKEYGRQRASLLTCMTCMQTSERHPTWEQDPRLAVAREVQWEVQWWNASMPPRDTNGHRLKDELTALAALAAAHPDEFQKLLAATDALHAWIERKKARTP
jgi:hypothetical protein